MSLWKTNKPPVWFPNAVATPAGWTNPATGELLVAIGGLSTTKEVAGTSALVAVHFDNQEAPLPQTGVTGSGGYSSHFAPKTYEAGDTITVIAQYTEPVNVVTTGGTPTVGISINGSAQTATYSSGSGTAFLKFTYTVQAGDTAAAGEMSITSPITLNGGTITDNDNASKNSPLTFTNTPGVDLVTVAG